MSNSIQLQFYSNHNGNLFGEITDDHIRAIVERAKEMGLLSTTEQSSAVQPAAPKHPAEECMLLNQQAIAAAKVRPAAPADDLVELAKHLNDDPADDEAAAEAIQSAAFSHITDGDARLIVAKIRRREIPGLPSPDEFAKVKAEVERLHSIIAEASDTLRTAMSEREAAIARAEKAEAELNDVLAKPDAAADHYRKMQAATYQELVSERSKHDTARTAHAEAMEFLRNRIRLEEKACGDVWLHGKHFSLNLGNRSHMDATIIDKNIMKAVEKEAQIDAHLSKHKDASK